MTQIKLPSIESLNQKFDLPKQQRIIEEKPFFIDNIYPEELLQDPRNMQKFIDYTNQAFDPLEHNARVLSWQLWWLRADHINNIIHKKDELTAYLSQQAEQVLEQGWLGLAVLQEAEQYIDTLSDIFKKLQTIREQLQIKALDVEKDQEIAGVKNTIDQEFSELQKNVKNPTKTWDEVKLNL